MTVSDPRRPVAPLRYVARVTVEFSTPCAVRRGEQGFLADSTFVTDPNGLPAIPGSSIAGVLRHAARAAGDDAVDDLFGRRLDAGAATTQYAEGAHEARQPPRGSRLTVSWAAVHDSNDQPVDGLLAPGCDRQEDQVLAALKNGVLRDHVRLDATGTAGGRGKFDERLVPAGARFTFDMILRGDEGHRSAWRRLLALLRRPDLRLGGGSRRGFGAFGLVRVLGETFDLRRTEEFQAYRALPTRLDAPTNLVAAPATHEDAAPGGTLSLFLNDFRAEGPWLFGGGPAETFEEAGDKSTVDIAPVREKVIEWDADGGRISDQERIYLPASAIKGALAHRVAWHYNRLTRNWADGLEGDGLDALTGANNRAVRAWFGHVARVGTADDADRNGESPVDSGTPGRLLFQDVYLSAQAAAKSERQTRWHVALDRFSGGTRGGALYQENVIPAFPLCAQYPIRVQPEGEPVDASVHRALGLTLRDLLRGRIAFGAGGNRGYGALRCRSVGGDDELLARLGLEDDGE